MSAEARLKVGFLDIVSTLPRMTTALPSVIRGVPGLLRKPNDEVSIGLVFQRVAAKTPHHPFLRFEGDTLSYGQANELVNRYASVLVERGVQRGDVVGVLAENSTRTLLVALAALKLGATAGMLNFHQRGEVLEHSLGILQSRVLVVDEDCIEALDTLDKRVPEGIVLRADDLDRQAGPANASNPAVTTQIRAKETAFYVFTSGTTGMPKASVMTHFRWLKSMSGVGSMGVRLRNDDVLYCCLPLYHHNALTVSLSSVLAAGATLAIGRKFSVSGFWKDVEDNGATAFCYIGELCRYLLTQDEKADNRDNTVRLIVGNGLRPEIWNEFTERFGIDRVAEFYSASECNTAFVNAFNIDRTAGFCPFPYAVVDYDDDTGNAKRNSAGRVSKVGSGGVGLLLSKVTDRAPFDGYTDAGATDKKLIRDAFSEGDCWIDTGDLVRQQGFRHVAFVDRLGDTFRWKGENVATTQVEGALGSHPDVDQAVVFGVDVPGADGKAGMAALTMRSGSAFDGTSLARAAYTSLPAYAVPLFVRVVDVLETTSTFKSKKVELRRAGYGDGDGRLYVLQGRSEGYVEAYDDYVSEVSAGKLPRN